MNKRGFTLVELLAVVVVLAVVSIIAIPITINIIENARKGALEESAKGLMDAANNYYALHSKDIDGNYVDFSIVDGKQTSSEKLKYKGSIDNGYLRLVDAKTMALCIDDNKYFAVKNMDSNEITIDEGVCSGEYDEDLLGYVTVGSAAYIGTRLDVKAYASRSALPNRSHEGYIGVITSTKISGYFLAPTSPKDPKEGLVWIVQSSDSEHVIETKTSIIGVSYVLQYESGNWNLKESYVYNDEWVQLSEYGGSDYTWNYDYTGHYEEFEAPFSGYYVIELWGASGGDANSTYTGGLGAYTKGKIYLNATEKLYVYVGQGGVNNGSATWNGGGTYSVTGGSGGGATDVRTAPTSAPTVWNGNDSLKTRIMVAAGGGGGYLRGSYVANGGAGGGLVGYNSYNTNCGTIGTGATQITAGTGSASGGFGYGANGGYYSAGGGSGWYGGGSGNNEQSGAGGSSYISGHNGCVSVDTTLYVNGDNNSLTGKFFTNTLMIDGKGYKWTDKIEEYVGMPTHDGTDVMAGNKGNGYAKITFKSFDVLTNEQYEKKAADVQNVFRYDYMGYYQKFVAPKAGKYKFELWGAQGGDADSSRTGGRGAYTKGEMTLRKGETFYIYVGQGGVNSGSATWNGGGTYSVAGGSGGGATDIRITPTSNLADWNGVDSLKSRIMVAAGGGGGYVRGSYVGNGGAAGGLTGGVGYNTNCGTLGTGATQIAAGTGSASGGFGYGANGGYYSAGGGAGWYGGGTGNNEQPGAGGSSYISGHAGCIAVDSTATPIASSYSKLSDSISYTNYKFTNTRMVDGAGYEWTTEKGSLTKMPAHDSETLITGKAGNGYVKITYIGN